MIGNFDAELPFKSAKLQPNRFDVIWAADQRALK
jgi:hypothetical protein